MEDFITKKNLEELFIILQATSSVISLDFFTQIFEYGNENSGLLMYNRFQDEYKRNIIKFYLSLCEIDRMKFYRYLSWVLKITNN